MPKIGAEAFNFSVDYKIIEKVFNNPKIELHLYQDYRMALGCGIVFFDSFNNGGFHMIGTLSEARGEGIGGKITQSLIRSAMKRNCQYCLLNASKLGKPVYEKLGFKFVGDLWHKQINDTSI